MDFLREFGLYDIVGYFVPGALLLFVAILTFAPKVIMEQLRPPNPSKEGKPSSVGKASSVLVFVIGAYITGHMVQAIASPLDRSLDDNDAVVLSETSNFRAEFKRSLQRSFGRSDYAPHEIRLLCKAYIQVMGVDSFYNIMDARFGFYRGLYVSFAISALLILLRFQAVSQRPWTYFLVLLICLTACRLSWSRCRDFERYRAGSLVRPFHVHSLLSEQASAAKQTPVDGPAKPYTNSQNSSVNKSSELDRAGGE